jgi:hypothetical protein
MFVQAPNDRISCGVARRAASFMPMLGGAPLRVSCLLRLLLASSQVSDPSTYGSARASAHHERHDGVEVAQNCGLHGGIISQPKHHHDGRKDQTDHDD